LASSFLKIFKPDISKKMKFFSRVETTNGPPRRAGAVAPRNLRLRLRTPAK
jgi:hypothetical protein